MAVSEEDVKEEELIQQDFKKASEIMDRIIEKFKARTFVPGNIPILFALCLIYARQLKYHKKEDESGRY